MLKFRLFFLSVCVLGLTLSGVSGEVFAQSVDEIKSQIEEHSGKIEALEKEINEYQKQLNVVSGQKQTLQSAIKTLDISRQQTSTQINLTQNKISSTNLKLEKLSYDIEDTEQLIALDQRTLAKSIRTMAETGDVSLVEQVFAADNLTAAWIAMDDAAAVNDALRANVANLNEAKRDLTGQKEDVSVKKNELTSLQGDLSNQKKSLDVAKSEKDKLLTQTKNQESTYQALIATKRAEQKIFESALSSLENSLASIGKGAAPTAQTGVLAWPYSSTFAASCVGKSSALGNTRCITQYFGNTAFATANAQIYNGSGHNAIDIGMPSGTPVLSALSGTVTATGNTDSVPGCYSFGKWVVVKHPNGLSTLYSHLSSIAVSAGQSVSTGQSLGNSGMTGYATGPHLHFGVYASAGIQIMTLAQYRGATTPCANATMPVAPKDAYLNPMSYL
ncbi:peptidoglycan DD-metalloendopeptidase family protein [Patescibacteria group bacterium]|nr:peptidoglycan DD-metalloendopeptidase family protein [Patescibacteria group bacterium]MBU2158995.1 peptidoglycan DD-metalloendopeptidase family protein [Patescibacteria group bacterium]MBU2220622.1 peptidoglycan DD-metalloendopeptidase family protein [Patescibacteria group bacterium]